MPLFSKILVGVDTRNDRHPELAQAAVVAQRCQAPLTVVDGVPDFSWPVRMVLSDCEHITQVLVEEKQEELEQLVAPLRKQGLEVDYRVLHGRSSVAIIREVLRDDYDLVIRTAKGSSSRRSGYFGNTAIRLLRKCPSAVWLVPAEVDVDYRHLLACINPTSPDDEDRELNDTVMHLTRELSEYEQAKYSVIHAWRLFGDTALAGRMDAKDFEKLYERARQKVKEQLDQFLAPYSLKVDDPNVHLMETEAGHAIPKFVRDQQIDLVVMGTVARAGLSGLAMGNTAENVLSQLECSVLTVKPKNFVSPIKLDEPD